MGDIITAKIPGIGPSLVEELRKNPRFIQALHAVEAVDPTPDSVPSRPTTNVSDAGTASTNVSDAGPASADTVGNESCFAFIGRFFSKLPGRIKKVMQERANLQEVRELVRQDKKEAKKNTFVLPNEGSLFKANSTLAKGNAATVRHTLRQLQNSFKDHIENGTVLDKIDASLKNMTKQEVQNFDTDKFKAALDGFKTDKSEKEVKAKEFGQKMLDRLESAKTDIAVAREIFGDGIKTYMDSSEVTKNEFLRGAKPDETALSKVLLAGGFFKNIENKVKESVEATVQKFSSSAESPGDFNLLLEKMGKPELGLMGEPLGDDTIVEPFKDVTLSLLKEIIGDPTDVTGFIKSFNPEALKEFVDAEKAIRANSNFEAEVKAEAGELKDEVVKAKVEEKKEKSVTILYSNFFFLRSLVPQLTSGGTEPALEMALGRVIMSAVNSSDPAKCSEKGKEAYKEIANLLKDQMAAIKNAVHQVVEEQASLTSTH